MPKNPVFNKIDELIRVTTFQTILSGQLSTSKALVHQKTVDSTILAMAVRGRYEVSFAGKNWMIHPGQTAIIPSNTPLRIAHHLDHKGIMQAKWIHLHITLYGTIDLLGLFDLPPHVDKALSKPISQTIDTLQAFEEKNAIHHQFDQAFQTQQIALSLTRHLIKLGKISQDRILQLHQSAHLMPVFQEIAQHLNKSITVNDLCKWAHLSPSRLHAVFIQATGMSPIRYVMQTRLTHARQQLVYTDHPISQIAHSLAFASPFHFSRVFKEAVGLSPSAYRQQNSLSNGL